jgi:hypothetical protein
LAIVDCIGADEAASRPGRRRFMSHVALILAQDLLKGEEKEKSAADRRKEAEVKKVCTAKQVGHIQLMLRCLCRH